MSATNCSHGVNNRVKDDIPVVYIEKNVGPLLQSAALLFALCPRPPWGCPAWFCYAWQWLTDGMKQSVALAS